MTPIERVQNVSESIRFLTTLAAGRIPERVPVYEGLAALTAEHKMHGLVMSALDSWEDELSTALRRELAPMDGQAWARQVFLASEMARVSSSLTQRGVEHYLIKGAAVENRFYDRTGERPYSDLDVVLLSSSSILEALHGLEYPDGHASLIQRLADDSWIQSVDVVLRSGVLVDLHLDPLKLGFRSRFADSVRGHLEPMAIDGTTIQTLDPTASLVVALLHLNRNRFRQLSGFADVARILARSQIDWDAFADLILADGLEVLIEGSLRAVRDQLDLDEAMFSGWTSRELVRRWTPRMAIWNLAWRQSSRLSGLSGRFRMGRRSQFLMPALCRGRAIWLFGWMTRRLFPPSPVLELNHPDVAGPYFVRLTRGRWNQMRHNRFHRARTERASHLVDDDDLPTLEE